MNIKHSTAVIGLLGLALSGAATQAQTLINFDVTASGAAVNAPTLFSAANPLRDEYASLGIRFRGSTETSASGGAVLRVASAPSGNNVLAFNGNATLLNGGSASAPENLFFDQSVSSFSMLAAGPGVNTVFFARALDANGFEIADVETTSTSGAYSTLSLSATGIRQIELTAQFLATPRQPFFTFDNLTFSVAPVPAPSSLGVAVLGVGVIGLAFRRRK